MRGLAHELQQPKGRIVQYGCDADLGDQRCKINLNQPAYRTDGGVVASLSGSPRLFAASGLDAYANDWFSRGLITWLSGANAGRTAQVKVHVKANGSVGIELWQRTSETIAPGDQFSIIGRLRQAIFDLQGEVRQCRELPRLPACAGQRLHAECRDPPGQERRQQPIQAECGLKSPFAWRGGGRCGGLRRLPGI